jgi:hypothetical protein
VYFQDETLRPLLLGQVFGAAQACRADAGMRTPAVVQIPVGAPSIARGHAVELAQAWPLIASGRRSARNTRPGPSCSAAGPRESRPRLGRRARRGPGRARAGGAGPVQPRRLAPGRSSTSARVGTRSRSGRVTRASATGASVLGVEESASRRMARPGRLMASPVPAPGRAARRSRGNEDIDTDQAPVPAGQRDRRTPSSTSSPAVASAAGRPQGTPDAGGPRSRSHAGSSGTSAEVVRLETGK